MKKDKNSKSFVISNLSFLNSQKKLLLNPSYQRSPVWALSQKQLLIDSILRDIDIPNYTLDKSKKMGMNMKLQMGNKDLEQYLNSQMIVSTYQLIPMIQMNKKSQAKSLYNQTQTYKWRLEVNSQILWF